MMGVLWPLLLGLTAVMAPEQDPLQWLLTQPVPERQAVARTLGQDTSTVGIRMLWLLAHDPDLEVRMAALTSALSRCPKERPGTCVGLLGFFSEAQTAPGTSVARDVLLRVDGCAQEETLTASKLELIARLAALLDRPRAPSGCRRALRLMAEDGDVEVSQTAAAALMALDR